MFHNARVFLAALLVGSNAAASITVMDDSTCGEGGALTCYGVTGGMSQNLDPSDVAYAATYFRYQGQSGNLFLTMNAK
jgi:hypothetical protein